MTLQHYPYWFLRHGETDWNARHLSQGRSDIPLNAKGVAQAEMAGRALAVRFLRGEKPFDHIVASPLQRALLTAEIVQKIIRHDAGQDLPLSCDINLQEVSFGEQEGKPMGEWYDIWIAGDYVPENGEVFADLRARSVAGVNAAFHIKEERAEAGSVPLIVAHGGLFRALRSAMGLPANVRLPNATPLFAHVAEGQWVLDYEKLPPLIL